MAPHIGRLTALFVKKHNTPGLFGDGGNLYLQITNANARSWIFRYGNRYAGLGSAFNVTLAELERLDQLLRKLSAAIASEKRNPSSSRPSILGPPVTRRPFSLGAVLAISENSIRHSACGPCRLTGKGGIFSKHRH